MQDTLIPLDPQLAHIAEIIDAEFDEMPGMRLTCPQVRRLWHVSLDDCEQALAYLCAAGRLAVDASGRYHRVDGS